MANIDLKNDKSWFVIFALFFIVPPLGIIALIGKIIYMVISGQQADQDTEKTYSKSYDRSYKRTYSEDTYSSSTEWQSDEVQKNLEQIEDELMESFSEWKEKREEEKVEDSLETEVKVSEAKEYMEYNRQGMPVTIEGIKPTLDITVDDAVEDKMDFYEEALIPENEYLEVPEAPESVAFDYDVDLSINDVHIDTEITFEGEPEDHHHEEGEPLKILTCTMCGTENRIYKVDVFETPTCEKCGMLLLDR